VAIEREKMLLSKACEKLAREKSIAARLPMHEEGERPNIRRFKAKSIVAVKRPRPARARPTLGTKPHPSPLEPA